MCTHKMRFGLNDAWVSYVEYVCRVCWTGCATHYAVQLNEQFENFEYFNQFNGFELTNITSAGIGAFALLCVMFIIYSVVDI